MEAHLPHHSIQRCHSESPTRSSSMGKDTKSLVEISHRHAADLKKGSAGVEQAKAAIGNALLERIGLVNLGEKGD